MAITIGNTSSAGHNLSITPRNLSHTINSGTNRLLVVGISERNKQTPQTMTYNGVAMTKLIEQASQIATSSMTLWYMLEASLPAGGAYNITYSNNEDRAWGEWFAICLSNVKQEVPFVFDGANTGNGQTNRSVTLNGLLNGDAILFMSTNNNTTTWTPAADYTEVFDATNGGDNFGSSTLIRRIVVDAGNYTPNSTASASGFVTSAALAVRPSFLPQIIQM